MHTQPKDAPIHQRRAHKRFDYAEHCAIEREDFYMKAKTQNISAGGVNLQLEGVAAIPVGKVVTLAIADFNPINAVVRWSEGRTFGLQFLTSVEGHQEIAQLIKTLETTHTY